MLQKYILTCFLLFVPILIWNTLLVNKLPAEFQADVFEKDIPTIITFGENASRMMMLILAFLMPLKLSKSNQWMGLTLYLIGLCLYFASWTILIHCPSAAWSMSLAGFMAPAVTPAVWLMGIWLMSGNLNYNIPLKQWLFPGFAILFLIFHNIHSFIVFYRIH